MRQEHFNYNIWALCAGNPQVQHFPCKQWLVHTVQALGGKGVRKCTTLSVEEKVQFPELPERAEELEGLDAVHLLLGKFTWKINDCY